MLPEPATAGSERGITVRTNLLSVRSEDSDFDCRTPNRITCWHQLPARRSTEGGVSSRCRGPILRDSSAGAIIQAADVRFPRRRPATAGAEHQNHCSHKFAVRALRGFRFRLSNSESHNLLER